MELLDLSKVAHRDTMTMPSGVMREVINQTDLGTFELARLNALQAEAETHTAVLAEPKLSAVREKKAKKELLRVVGETVKLLIPTITTSELSKLSYQNREQIIIVWIGAHSTGDDENPQVPTPRTGVGSSPGSKRSTAATRKPGGTSRAGRSSRT